MAVESFTRRQFLDLSWKTALGILLAGCAPTPTTSNIVSTPSINQAQPILDFTRPLPGSTTVESLLPQHWYVATQTGFNLMDQNASKVPPPLVNQPKASYVAPEIFFHDAPIDLGDGKKYKVGDSLPEGQYRFIPLTSLQAIAISPNQLLQAEGAASWGNVYEATANGLSLSGIMVRTGLIGALANLSINGGLQREIEGSRIISIVDSQGKVRFIDLDNPQIAQNSRTVAIQAKAQSADAAKPTIRMWIDNASYSMPDGWKPPEKRHCDEDLEEYYARLLLDTTLAMVFVNDLNQLQKTMLYDQAFEQAQKSPILKKVAENNVEADKIDKRLREKGCFFYPEGGSVFMDFKLMRERAYLRAGGYSNWDIRRPEFEKIFKIDQSLQDAYKKGMDVLKAPFNDASGVVNRSLTTEQALNIARQIIKQWWW